MYYSPYDLTDEDNEIIQFFDYSHLPSSMVRNTSKRFGDFVTEILSSVEASNERTVMLRKMLEAKDCAVRSMIITLKNENDRERNRGRRVVDV